MKRPEAGIAIITKREPSAHDLALLRLDLSDEECEQSSRVGKIGPGALHPPPSRTKRD
jgi:hypothetical protein